MFQTTFESVAKVDKNGKPIFHTTLLGQDDFWGSTVSLEGYGINLTKPGRYTVELTIMFENIDNIFPETIWKGVLKSTCQIEIEHPLRSFIRASHDKLYKVGHPLNRKK